MEYWTPSIVVDTEYEPDVGYGPEPGYGYYGAMSPTTGTILIWGLIGAGTLWMLRRLRYI